MRRVKLPSFIGRGCASVLRVDELSGRSAELSTLYTTWAQRRQMGDTTTFLQGAKQAYTALGLFVASKVETTQSRATSEEKKVSEDKGMQDTSFMSPSLVDDLRQSEGNPFEFAHPHDVVTEASIIILSKLEESATAKNEPGLHYGISAQKDTTGEDVEDAMVMTSMHVMLPPERFLPHYTFYRSRFIGGSDALARSAAVWLASTPVYPLVKFADVVHRLLGRGPLKVSLTEEYCRSALKMTDDAIANPPLYRKHVLFRLDAKGRWLLESVDNVGFVFKPTDTVVL